MSKAKTRALTKGKGRKLTAAEYTKIFIRDDGNLRISVERRARGSFTFFLNTIWAISVELMGGETFRKGKHVNEWAGISQNNSFVSIEAPRKHLKSTIAEAYVAWKLFKLKEFKGLIQEVFYYSYTSTLAAEHTERIKNHIAINDFFRDFIDNTHAKTYLDYQLGKKRFICKPEGILAATRGRHPHGVVCDDILNDGTEKADAVTIVKITKYFLEKIVSLPKEEGWLKLVGTPQDRKDLFNEIKKLTKFDVHKYKAIINHKTKEVLWPELFSYERLIDIRDNEIGPKAFEKEYQCTPVRSAEQYIEEERLEAAINTDLKNWADLKEARKAMEAAEAQGKPRPFKASAAGLDIGKKTHPSHFAVFEKESGTQLLSKWFDRVDYEDQIAYCDEAIEIFNIERLNFDNTRGEFENKMERGELGPEYEPVVFSGKSKFAMAAGVDKALSRKKIQLINDERQTDQIRAVDNDLKAIATAQGHGDSFFSICLAVLGMEEDVLPDFT